MIGQIDHLGESSIGKLNYVHPSMEPDWDKLPCDCCKGTLRRYFEDGIFTGDSMFAVLSGDLYDAGGRLDDGHWKVLRDTMRFIYNELPANCAFSRERVIAWCNKGGARNDSAFNKDFITVPEETSVNG